MSKVSKEKKIKLKKIKAIPARRIDFYRRLQKSPEKTKARNMRLAAVAAGIAVVLALLAVLAWLFIQKHELQSEVDSLQAYVENESNIELASRADELMEKTAKQSVIVSDLSNASENILSYPLVTSEVFKTLEDCCPDKVEITITGYSSDSGQLKFDAVAPEVTDVSEVIEIWKTLDIFQSVYYTGYTQNDNEDGYTVKVVCVLSEQAGRKTAEEVETVSREAGK